jgi:hypothetical protein
MTTTTMTEFSNPTRSRRADVGRRDRRWNRRADRGRRPRPLVLATGGRGRATGEGYGAVIGGQSLPEPGFGSVQTIRPWMVGPIGEFAVT